VSDRFALVDLTAATMTGPGYGLVPDAAVVIADGIVEWVGPRNDLHPGVEPHSLGGRLVTPGLVDCHTHLVFAGNRAGELAARTAGAGYEEIAAAGGGIRSTVAATRAATVDELLSGAARRLDRLHHTGATTVEVKTGYGLDLPTELEMLRVARRLGELSPVQVTTTLLAAHVVPDEWRDDPDGYIDLIVS
jgi:imidazolonepropionase